MTKRDRSAERRVASFLSQNSSAAPVKVPEPPADDLFTSAKKQRARMPAEPFADIAPHQSSSPTSRASAEKNATTMRSKMFLIYAHIESKGAYGATRQEIADDLGISLQTVCGRVRRLYQMGLIGSNPGDVRSNRLSGFDNEVMVHEDRCLRWQPDQQRPAQRPSWEEK